MVHTVLHVKSRMRSQYQTGDVQNALGFVEKPYHRYHYWLNPWRSASDFHDRSHIPSISTAMSVFDLPLRKGLRHWGSGRRTQSEIGTMDSKPIITLTHNRSRTLFGWIIDNTSCPGFKYPIPINYSIWRACCKQLTALYLFRTSIGGDKINQGMMICSRVFQLPSSIYVHQLIPQIFPSFTGPYRLFWPPPCSTISLDTWVTCSNRYQHRSGVVWASWGDPRS